MINNKIIILLTLFVFALPLKTRLERGRWLQNRLHMAGTDKPNSGVIWNEGFDREHIPNWQQVPPEGVQWNTRASKMSGDQSGDFLKPGKQGGLIGTSRDRKTARLELMQSQTTIGNTEDQAGSVPGNDVTQIEWNSNLVSSSKTENTSTTTQSLLNELLNCCRLATKEGIAAFGKGGGHSGSSEWHGFRTDKILLESVESVMGRMTIRSALSDGSAEAWGWMLASPVPLRVCLDSNSQFAVFVTAVPSANNRCAPHSPQSGSLLLTRLLRGKIDQVKHIVSSDGSYREISTVAHPRFEGECVWRTFAGSSRQMINSQGCFSNFGEGTAVFVDIIFFPPGKEVFGYDTGALTSTRSSSYPENDGTMVLESAPCNPHYLFKDVNSTEQGSDEVFKFINQKPAGLKLSSKRKGKSTGTDKKNKEELTSKEWIKELSTDVGGLEKQLQDITRRVLASRTLPPEVRNLIGINHVRGLLLHGPPGCGKTLIARELARRLNARPPKMVSGPELLDKWVGEAERNVRRLFLGAEDELERCIAAGGDPLSLPLHIICFDEIDALCKKRGSLSGDTSGVRDSVVNQLLSKLDGLKSLDNVLVVGMTNRLELLDEAMLRPGRLEVIMRIPPPDRIGRKQILGIHLKQAYESNKIADDVDVELLASSTHGFTGAHLAGLVRSATSFAITRWQDQDQEDDPSGSVLKIKMGDFQRALKESHNPISSRSKRDVIKTFKELGKNLKEKMTRSKF